MLESFAVVLIVPHSPEYSSYTATEQALSVSSISMYEHRLTVYLRSQLVYRIQNNHKELTEFIIELRTGTGLLDLFTYVSSKEKAERISRPVPM